MCFVRAGFFFKQKRRSKNSVSFHRPPLIERGLRPNGYFPLMRQPLFFCKNKSPEALITLGFRAFCYFRDGVKIVAGRRLSGEFQSFLQLNGCFLFYPSSVPEHTITQGKTLENIRKRSIYRRQDRTLEEPAHRGLASPCNLHRCLPRAHPLRHLRYRVPPGQSRRQAGHLVLLRQKAKAARLHQQKLS